MSIRLIAAFVALVLPLLSTSCSSNEQGGMTPIPTLLIMTSTLPANATSPSSQTPLVPVALPTLTPVDGVTMTQINVRLEPSTASSVLGVIPADMRVEITGKDPGGNWWQIKYPHPDAIDGKGWITAQYVTTPSLVDVPIIGGTASDPNRGSVAIIQQQLNVRSGPGTGFNSLGTLNPQDVVNLTGKDPNGAWLQIDFAEGPEGKGWVNAAFVRAQEVDNLPIVAESGLVLGTGTPTGIPLTPTPTVIPAWEDRDSAENPIANVTFESTGTQAFTHSGDLSTPEGDSEDWIAFQPYDRFVYVSLECKGSATVEIQTLENGLPVMDHIMCGGQMQEVSVNAGSKYLFHLRAAPSANTLQYTSYILTIKTRA